MKELSSYEICLLIYLCYKRDKKKFMGGLHPKAQGYCKAWKRLQDIVNTYCEDIAIKVIEPSEAADSAVRKNTSLIIQVEKKELLEKFLDDYIAYFEDDALISYNYDKLNFNRQDKQFEVLIGKFRNSTDKNKILTTYFVDDTKYLPMILWGLRKECIGFKDIRFSLAPNDEQLDKIPDIELRKRKLRNNGLDLSIIDFCITLDLSDFIRLRGLRKAENKAKENPDTIEFEETELSIPEWKLFHCIFMAVKDLEVTGIQIISESAFTSMGIRINKTFEKDRSGLNTKLRNVLTKTSKYFLIKPNKDDEHKYNIDMALFKEFCNKYERKYKNFLIAYKAKRNLP